MAADSRMTVQRSEERAENEQRTLVQQQLVLSDSAYKVVELQSIGVGIAIYDAGIIASQPADTHVHRFEEEKVSPDDDVLSVSEKFLKYFQDNFPGVAVGYHIAGYRTENRASVPYVLVGHTVREPGLRRVNADSDQNVQYGITRAGDTLIANRLIDQNYLPLFAAMPLQDAVDYAVHLIRTTIDTMRFEPRFPSVGGPIDVLVVTPAGLAWVQRKELRGDS
jgi:hypothetical protein